MGKSNNGNTEAASIIGRFKGAFSSVATEVTKAVTEALAAPKSAAEINAEEALLTELKNSTTKISRLTEILSRTRDAGKPLEERMKYVEAILTSRPVLSLEQIAAIDKSAKSEFEYFSDGDLEGVFNRASKLFQSKTTEYAMEYSIMSANRPALNIINLLDQENLDTESQSIIYEGLRKREDDIKKAFSNLSTMELEGYVDRFSGSFDDIALFAGKVKNEKEVDNLIIEETKAKAAKEAEIAAAKEAEIKAALEKQKKIGKEAADSAAKKALENAEKRAKEYSTINDVRSYAELLSESKRFEAVSSIISSKILASKPVSYQDLGNLAIIAKREGVDANSLAITAINELASNNLDKDKIPMFVSKLGISQENMMEIAKKVNKVSIPSLLDLFPDKKQENAISLINERTDLSFNEFTKLASNLSVDDRGASLINLIEKRKNNTNHLNILLENIEQKDVVAGLVSSKLNLEKVVDILNLLPKEFKNKDLLDNIVERRGVNSFTQVNKLAKSIGEPNIPKDIAVKIFNDPALKINITDRLIFEEIKKDNNPLTKEEELKITALHYLQQNNSKPKEGLNNAISELSREGSILAGKPKEARKFALAIAKENRIQVPKTFMERITSFFEDLTSTKEQKSQRVSNILIKSGINGNELTDSKLKSVTSIEDQIEANILNSKQQAIAQEKAKAIPAALKAAINAECKARESRFDSDKEVAIETLNDLRKLNPEIANILQQASDEVKGEDFENRKYLQNVITQLIAKNPELVGQIIEKDPDIADTVARNIKLVAKQLVEKTMDPDAKLRSIIGRTMELEVRARAEENKEAKIERSREEIEFDNAYSLESNSQIARRMATESMEELEIFDAKIASVLKKIFLELPNDTPEKDLKEKASDGIYNELNKRTPEAVVREKETKEIDLINDLGFSGAAGYTGAQKSKIEAAYDAQLALGQAKLTLEALESGKIFENLIGKNREILNNLIELHNIEADPITFGPLSGDFSPEFKKARKEICTYLQIPESEAGTLIELKRQMDPEISGDFKDPKVLEAAKSSLNAAVSGHLEDLTEQASDLRREAIKALEKPEMQNVKAVAAGLVGAFRTTPKTAAAPTPPVAASPRMKGANVERGI